MGKKPNSYELSRAWFDFCFENPEKIKPNHTAVYFFAIEHCNRLAWKEKFGFPSSMAMEAVGIKSYNTYIKTLHDLVEWGFIFMVQRSKNQYSSNIISLTYALSKNNKALEKALIKHATKQSESTVQSTVQSIDSINKQYNNKQDNKVTKQTCYSFDDFFQDYDKSIGKKEAEAKYKSISEHDRNLIKEHLPLYVKSTPDKKFRKAPTFYLNGECWNDEIIFDTKNGQTEKERLNAEHAKLFGISEERMAQYTLVIP